MAAALVGTNIPSDAALPLPSDEHTPKSPAMRKRQRIVIQDSSTPFAIVEPDCQQGSFSVPLSLFQPPSVEGKVSGSEQLTHPRNRVVRRGAYADGINEGAPDRPPPVWEATGFLKPRKHSKPSEVVSEGCIGKHSCETAKPLPACVSKSTIASNSSRSESDKGSIGDSENRSIHDSDLAMASLEGLALQPGATWSPNPSPTQRPGIACVDRPIEWRGVQLVTRRFPSSVGISPQALMQTASQAPDVLELLGSQLFAPHTFWQSTIIPVIVNGRQSSAARVDCQSATSGSSQKMPDFAEKAQNMQQNQRKCGFENLSMATRTASEMYSVLNQWALKHVTAANTMRDTSCSDMGSSRSASTSGLQSSPEPRSMAFHGSCPDLTLGSPSMEVQPFVSQMSQPNFKHGNIGGGHQNERSRQGVHPQSQPISGPCTFPPVPATDSGLGQWGGAENEGGEALGSSFLPYKCGRSASWSDKPIGEAGAEQITPGKLEAGFFADSEPSFYNILPAFGQILDDSSCTLVSQMWEPPSTRRKQGSGTSVSFRKSNSG